MLIFIYGVIGQLPFTPTLPVVILAIIDVDGLGAIIFIASGGDLYLIIWFVAVICSIVVGPWSSGLVLEEETGSL